MNHFVKTMIVAFLILMIFSLTACDNDEKKGTNNPEHMEDRGIVSTMDTVENQRPWENGGKSVEEYTWLEFEALSPELKDAFFNTFESVEAFRTWNDRAQVEEQVQTERPWENGGKSVEEYTWLEFEALSPELKDAFFNTFESVEAFRTWSDRAQVED